MCTNVTASLSSSFCKFIVLFGKDFSFSKSLQVQTLEAIWSMETQESMLHPSTSVGKYVSQPVILCRSRAKILDQFPAYLLSLVSCSRCSVAPLYSRCKWPAKRIKTVLICIISIYVNIKEICSESRLLLFLGST